MSDIRHERQHQRGHRIIVTLGGVGHSLTKDEAKAMVSSLETALHYLWCARMTDWIQEGKQGKEPTP